jgi:20S proteasome subunit beta 6
MASRIGMIFGTLAILLAIRQVTAKFEPYAMNGGLVSAIAGKDYVIIASDTRLTDGGYSILTRNHLQSRLWATTTDFGLDVELLEEDGSVSIPCSTATEKGQENKLASIFSSSPTFIASSGCSSDCEALKRQIRSELDAHQHWNYGKNTLTPTGIANLLGQTLYSRRSFPFYSFCILAGLEKKGHAHVHVYDAIGSNERVAVACNGNAKEMLQPILDRMFATSIEDEDNLEVNDNSFSTELQRDGRAVHTSQQRVGLKLEPPVETHVMCGAKEAMDMLVKGYRSVAEREISVGDSVVICVIRRHQGRGDPSFEMQVCQFPLKKH